MICEFEKGTNSQLTENFWLSEFHCRCEYEECKTTVLSIELVEGLEALRKVTNLPIHVTCGFRCKRHNQETKGAPNSKHLVGIAADIWCESFSPKRLADAAKRVPLFAQGGIGIYLWGIHVDHRGTPTRWFG